MTVGRTHVLNSLSFSVSLASLMGLATLPSPPAAHGASSPADTLVILSTTDVKGRINPLGLHIPCGGLARRAGYVEAVRASYRQLLLVDNGGFVPEDELHREAAWLQIDVMKLMGTDAAGVGANDLSVGYAELHTRAAQARLPLLSANLLLTASRLPAFEPWKIVKVGSVSVGVFGLINDKIDRGPARDSLTIVDPTVTAEIMVSELRKKGATVVVLLSQLGRPETEALVDKVDGIDVAIAGGNVPLTLNGRRFKNTMVVYSGEKGEYLGRTIIVLDASKHAKSMDCATVRLGPEIPSNPQVAALVQPLEKEFNRRLFDQGRDPMGDPILALKPDHYVGYEVCARCHQLETAQWKTTEHSRSMKPLGARQMDSAPECLPCHSLGYNQEGGFINITSTPKLASVQCESCHGMGTSHEAFASHSAAKALTDAMCKTCHTEVTSPTFTLRAYEPHILHHVPSDLKPLPPSPAHAMMGGGR